MILSAYLQGGTTTPVDKLLLPCSVPGPQLHREAPRVDAFNTADRIQYWSRIAMLTAAEPPPSEVAIGVCSDTIRIFSKPARRCESLLIHLPAPALT